MWPYTHRGISPIPPAYPRLGRHSPWEDHRNNNNGPGMMLSMQESAVLRFLPGLRHLVELAGSSSHNSRALIDQLVVTSEEILPYTKWNPLDEEELRGAYIWVLRALSRVSPGEADYVLSHDLTQKLEERLATDRNDARELNGMTFFHRRAQYLFRCLAEISCRTESIKLGTILLQFFSRHASLIASTDNSSALVQWCYSILSAHTRDNDRFECLRKIVRIRPELPDVIRGRGRKAEDVADRLDWVVSQMERRELKPSRRHEDPMACYPPHQLFGGGGGGRHEELEIDVFGAQFAVFGQIRERGRSGDRLAVPHIHRHEGLGRRVLEERGFADPRLDLPPVFGSGPLEIGRPLLLNEEDPLHGSLLHPTISRSHVDPLDMYGMRAGKCMASRDPLFPLSSEVEYDI